LDLVTGDHVILTADGELGARAARAAEAAGLPATVTAVEQAVMRRLGAELLVVRPDQVVSAVWPPPATGHSDHPGNSIDFLDTTMAMLCGHPMS
jgi:hypothetical protein